MADKQLGADAYFSIVPEYVVDCGDPRAVQVFAILARYTDKEHKAFPTRKTIARRADCSPDTVDRALQVLENMGAIHVERVKKPDGSFDANRYTLVYTRKGGRTGAGTPSRTSADRVVAPARTQREPGNENQENDIAPAEQTRNPNAYWDALEQVFGYRPIGSEASLWGSIVEHVKECGDPPEEIPRRAALWLVGPVWEDRKAPPRLTPAALRKHWQWLGSRLAGATESDLEKWRQEYKKQERVREIESGGNQ